MRRSLTLMGAGFVLTLFAYHGLHQRRTVPAFTDAIEFTFLEASDEAAAPRGGIRSNSIVSRDYALRSPVSSLTERVLSAGTEDSEGRVLRLLANRFFGITLKLLDCGSHLPWDEMLARGRPPHQGQAEIAAGSDIEGDQIDFGGRSRLIVGWFRPEVTALRRCVVAYESPWSSILAMDRNAPMAHASLLPLDAARRNPTRGAQTDPKLAKSLRLIHSRRLHLPDFILYVLGVAALYWGGTLFMLCLLERLAVRPLPRMFSSGVQFLNRHRSRLRVLSYLYFGTTLFLYFAAYFAPDVQGFLWSLAQGLVRGDRGILAWVGHAYRSGGIAEAAWTTWVVNLFIGTIRDITLPSVIVPGAGVVTGMLRAVLWGVVLSPSTDIIAGKFKVVSLIEGLGYVIAMCFAAEMFAAVRKGRGKRWSDYRNALSSNLYGLLIVAVVLGIAAIVKSVVVLLLPHQY